MSADTIPVSSRNSLIAADFEIHLPRAHNLKLVCLQYQSKFSCMYKLHLALLSYLFKHVIKVLKA